MPTNDIDYTVTALRAFLAEHVNPDNIPTGQPAPIRNGATVVLNTVALADNTDVRTIDVDALLHRFASATSGRLKASTINTYDTVFRRAVRMFLRWRADEPQWWLPTQPTRHAPLPGRAPAALTHHFPLRPDITIRLTLPVDLTTAEAERLARFINALAQ